MHRLILKAHRALEFFASLLNRWPANGILLFGDVNQGWPAGMGVIFRPVCIMQSDWDCTIEPDFSIRLGLCVVKILSRSGAKRLLAEKEKRPFASLNDFKHRVRLNKDELRTLAEIGALNGLANHRREALWEVECALPEDDLFERQAEKTVSPLSRMNYTGTDSGRFCRHEFNHR